MGLKFAISFYDLLYMADMIPVLNVTPMVSRFPQES